MYSDYHVTGHDQIWRGFGMRALPRGTHNFISSWCYQTSKRSEHNEVAVGCNVFLVSRAAEPGARGL